jgi:hypothetical protein
VGEEIDDESPIPERAGRSANGKFAPGNTEALTHGGYSKQAQAGDLPSQAESAAIVRERVQEIVNDLGGRDEVSTVLAGQVRQHGRLEMLEEHLWHQIEDGGITTAKGNTRACVTLWLKVIDRLQRSAMTLGIERKQRQVNPLDAVRAAVEEANKR